MSDRTESIVQLLNTRHRSTPSQFGVDGEPLEASGADDYTPFALGRVSSRPQMMLVLKKCTGELTALAYSLLTQVYSTDPAKGFSLTFGDTKVQIEGDNLTKLFGYVCQHRAIEIVEADRATLMQVDCECAVSKIVVVSRT